MSLDDLPKLQALREVMFVAVCEGLLPKDNNYGNELFMTKPLTLHGCMDGSNHPIKDFHAKNIAQIRLALKMSDVAAGYEHLKVSFGTFSRLACPKRKYGARSAKSEQKCLCYLPSLGSFLTNA